MKRILVVEDDPHNLDNLLEILEFNNYEAIAATGGQEAIAMLRNEEIDLILCDWQMPGITGLSVLLDVRSRARTQNIPFVMLTAFAADNDRSVALSLGADAYVTKPFDSKDLLDAIASLLNCT